MYSMVQGREKEKGSRYIQEVSAPAAVTVYQTCNIMYICNKYFNINRVMFHGQTVMPHPKPIPRSLTSPGLD